MAAVKDLRVWAALLRDAEGELKPLRLLMTEDDVRWFREREMIPAVIELGSVAAPCTAEMLEHVTHQTLDGRLQ